MEHTTVTFVEKLKDMSLSELFEFGSYCQSQINYYVFDNDPKDKNRWVSLKEVINLELDSRLGILSI